MKALIVREFGGPDRIEIIDLALPEPGPHQLRVRVEASAVNPIDLSIRNGALAGAGLLGEGPDFALGLDVAGSVDAVGAAVRRFAAGDAVIGLRDILSAIPGAHAEYVLLEEGALAPAPRSVSAAEAATLPLNGLTADRSLELAGVRAGQTLLVTGAGGAVGGFAVQLASLRGIRVVAVASEADRDLVTGFGAADFVPRGEPLAEVVRSLVPGGVDAVIDAALLGVSAHDALRGGGTFVALVRPFAPPPLRGTEVIVQEVYADGPRLAELSALVDAGHLSLRVAETLPLSAAARAHELIEASAVRGKVVLVN
jgi:NADPH:quinone reductase-like Zn-dependent oxidoreductase